MASEYSPSNDSVISPEPILADAFVMDGVVDRLAAGLYNLASMLVGEGDDSVRLVETAIANTDVSACEDPDQARISGRRSLCEGALDILRLHNAGGLAAPEGLKASGNCIDEDDLDAVEIAREDLERMSSGPDRERVRDWLAGLPTALRTIFVLRAVAGLSAAETAAMLEKRGGPEAAGWNAEAVRSVFREGLCSLASQLLHATSAR
ncbi:MAG: hypothetical protein ABSF16_08130 [Terracidiphilus sp.]|jgi:hypothetical protein